MTEIKMEKLGSQMPTKLIVSEENLPSFLDKQIVKKRLNEFNMNLLEWQHFILRNSLSIKDSSLFYKNVCLSVPRQNGKTEIIIARAFIGLIFLSEKMVYSSYREESANAIFNRLLDLIEESPSSIKAYFPNLPSRKVKEKIVESVDPRTGKKLGRIRFITRKGGAGRGLSESIIFIDEAQNLTAGENDALSGTIATFKNGQLWYFGTPEPAENAASLGTSSQKNNNSLNLFSEIRKKILKGLKYSFWAEWSIPKIVPRTEKSAWYLTNPSLGYEFESGKGITEEYLESRVSDDVSFAVEHLGFWSQQEKNSAIEITIWNDLFIEKEEINSFKNGKVSIAIKSNTDDSEIEIVTAIRKRNSRDVFVEVSKRLRMDIPWENDLWNFIKPYINNSKCSSIIIDGITATSQIKNILIQNGKWKVNGNRFKQGKITFAGSSDLSLSCANLIGAINEKSVFHNSQEVLDAAIADAAKRIFRSGSGFGFYSISGKTSANLVETVALALNEASKQRIEKETTESEIGKVTYFDNVTRF